MHKFTSDQWALILGGSSGFGLASAKKLSRHGMSVCVVHRDRRGSMARIEEEFESIRAQGAGFVSLNVDALSEAGRQKTMDTLAEALGDGRVRLLMHSIAFGNLKPLVPTKEDRRGPAALGALARELGIDAEVLEGKVKAAFSAGALALHALVEAGYPERVLEDEDFERTIFSMGTSLVTWVQDLHRRQLFAADARVLGMTSEGNEVAWRGYSAVSAAKVALESVCRSIALEYGPYGIRANTVQAGVTDTPALRAIPGSEQMKAAGALRNPMRRLTTPEDVADVVALLCTDEAGWINGALLRVDGGEHIASA